MRGPCHLASRISDFVSRGHDGDTDNGGAMSGMVMLAAAGIMMVLIYVVLAVVVALLHHTAAHPIGRTRRVQLRARAVLRPQ